MNIIWIISDSFRRDHLGAYGNPWIHTPALDALATRAVRFDRHYIAAFPTMPTRADYLTGRWTLSYMQWEPLSGAEVTLPRILSTAGYTTAAFVDTPFYTRNGMNYDSGFQEFSEVVGQMHYPLSIDPASRTGHINSSIYGGDVRDNRRCEEDYFAPRTFSNAMRWLERHHRDKFFMYIDTWDPHEPWEAPAYYTERYWPGFDGNMARPLYGYWPQTPGVTEEMVKKAHAAYCGEITMVDTWFGCLMRRLENMGLLDNTAVIFTSDHGYYFGEHGGLVGKMVFARDKKTGAPLNGIWSHSPFYEEVSAVPLLIYVPSMPPGVYPGLTSAVDMMPTVLDILDLPRHPRVQGQSLLPALRDPRTPGRPWVVSAHPLINVGESLRSVDGVDRLTEKYSEATITTDEWTLLFAVEPGVSELYNLKDDPRQEHNLIQRFPEKARELHQIFIRFMRETAVPERIVEPRLTLNL